ncbi:hypothetical protein ACFYPX_18060 [Micromonospora zamorensis]|uniref:hypothetical protein n=1 Tax=Micromonospora zamorensis TaxID=709883 RepID=UPI0036770770
MDTTTDLTLLVAADGGIDPTLGVILAGVASALAALLASWLTSRVAGRAQRDTAVLKWAEQMQASEAQARKEAQESRERAERIRDEADTDVESLRDKLDDLDVRLRQANQLASQLTDTLTMVASEVWRPEPDVEALRRLVGRPGGINGRAV